jgi:hypothetical protein
MKVLLILSSALCNPELQFMFGKLPASRIPVAGKSLIQHQLKMGADFDKVFVTHPEDFPMPPCDDRVTMLSEYSSKHPRPLSHVLYYAVTRIVNHLNGARNCEGVELHVLWGDTLISKWATTPCIGVAATRPGNFNWLDIRLDNGRNAVFIGYFMAPLNTVARVIAPDDDISEALDWIHDEVAVTYQDYTDGVDWFDFGHAATYFLSKQNFLTSRHFNQLRIEDNVVSKSGTPAKIHAEFDWYSNLPVKLRKYTPALLSYDCYGSYEIEYLPLPTLAELYVFGNQEFGVWHTIIDKCLDFIGGDPGHHIDSETVLHEAAAFRELIEGKTRQRIQQLQLSGQSSGQSDTFSEIVPELTALSEHCIAQIPDRPDRISVVHGDLCFSNIAYDHRTNSIKVFDPRGLNGFDERSIYGDVRYELAKLLHSMVGYDSIIAGHYSVSAINPPPLNREVISYFSVVVRERFGIDFQEVLAMTALLFFSMLPLHSDSLQRQLALFKKGQEIYQLMEQQSCAI